MIALDLITKFTVSGKIIVVMLNKVKQYSKLMKHSVNMKKNENRYFEEFQSILSPKKYLESLSEVFHNLAEKILF